VFNSLVQTTTRKGPSTSHFLKTSFKVV